MEQSFAKMSDEFQGDIPKPDFWGGYALLVDKIEFWQGRANRMHDRIVYTKDDTKWLRQRILP